MKNVIVIAINVMVGFVLLKTPPSVASGESNIRSDTVDALHLAMERDDLSHAALLNSVLAHEAFQLVYSCLKKWEGLRDPETGLVPRSAAAGQRFWNPKDVGADLFPFLFLASKYTDKESESLWLSTLANERKICGPMPCTILFEPATVKKEDTSDIIFGASEYAKDGLLAIAERYGRGPWFQRMEEIMGALIDNAYIETGLGKICSDNTEVNGEMLQVLSRLYWATGKKKYLDMAERIGESYLLNILPHNQYLPVQYWDFANKRTRGAHFQFRDHGGEIIAGLTELYLVEKLQGRPQAERYRTALKKLLDRIVTAGRTEDGMWYNSIDTKSCKPLDNNIVDTWGYIVNAFMMFDMAEGGSLYSEEIRRSMNGAIHKSFIWEYTPEGQPHYDGYADAIESMLYLLPWFNMPEYHLWVDNEIEKMFHAHSQISLINSEYLDGNFIRTSLLYASYKTQGVLMEPWREDVYLGAAYDKDNKQLYIHLNTDVPWNGLLKFDIPRHHTIWNLPFEYPRVNQTPEWYVVKPQKNYLVTDINTGEEYIYSGETLSKGLRIRTLGKDNLVRLKIREHIVEL